MIPFILGAAGFLIYSIAIWSIARGIAEARAIARAEEAEDRYTNALDMITGLVSKLSGCTINVHYKHLTPIACEREFRRCFDHVFESRLSYEDGKLYFQRGLGEEPITITADSEAAGLSKLAGLLNHMEELSND